jgi:hypothetical protein
MTNERDPLEKMRKMGLNIDMNEALNNYMASKLGSSKKNNEKELSMRENEDPSLDEKMADQSISANNDDYKVEGIATKRI